MDFSSDNNEWWWRWRTYTSKNSSRELSGHHFNGDGSLHVFASANNAKLVASIFPENWNIDQHPHIFIRYRADPGVKLAVDLEAFESSKPYRRLLSFQQPFPGENEVYAQNGNKDQGAKLKWTELYIDARKIRTRFSRVNILKRFALYTISNVKKAKGFWIDEFAILPKDGVLDAPNLRIGFVVDDLRN
jgi:hypothetical protein